MNCLSIPFIIVLYLVARRLSSFSVLNTKRAEPAAENSFTGTMQSPLNQWTLL